MFTDVLFSFSFMYARFKSSVLRASKPPLKRCTPQNAYLCSYSIVTFLNQCPPPSPCFSVAVCWPVGGVENPHTKDVALSPALASTLVGKPDSGAQHGPRGRYRALGFAYRCVQFDVCSMCGEFLTQLLPCTVVPSLPHLLHFLRASENFDAFFFL